jgi:hypothetical protein
MHGENLLVNDGGDWQAIEAVCEGLPQLDIIPSLALIVETINAVNRGTLVVTSKDEKVFWVLNLICEKETNSLERLFASIYIISQK